MNLNNAIYYSMKISLCLTSNTKYKLFLQVHKTKLFAIKLTYFKLSETSCVTITANERVVPTSLREFPSTRAPSAYGSLVAKVTNASSVTNKLNNKNAST